MRKRKTHFGAWLICGTVIALAVYVGIRIEPTLWDYARPVEQEERAQRQQIVDSAVGWLGSNEEEGSHRAVIDLYNRHTPLARGYAVQYDDEWCSTFVSAVAIQCGRTDIIPTECGCERQIQLFMELGAWEEADDYVPLPGDYIFYHWDCWNLGDCEAWSDHVGIVVGTWMNWIKVVEGNKDDAVRYRWLPVNDRQIRGYGIPDYG